MIEAGEGAHRLVFSGDAIIDAGDLRIAGVSDSVLYGKGIFTTVGIHNGRPFLWEKHWRRLAENADRLGIDLSIFNQDSVAASLMALLKANKVEAGRARICFLDESSTGIWKLDSKKLAKLFILTAGPRRTATAPKVTLSPYSINSASPLAGTKSINYIENLLALREARSRGFDEAIRVNEKGYLASACMANIFWLRDGMLFTPSLRTGCLPGTTREFVLGNLPCREVESDPDEIRQADEIFLTSAGIGVVGASEFDGRRLANRPHKILRLIAEALKKE